MNNKRRILTRRDFIKDTTYGALGITFGLGAGTLLAGQKPFAAENPLSRVVLVRNENAVNTDGTINSETVKQMIDKGMQTLAGESDILKAWQKYINPDARVGVKYTRCSWMRIPTEQETVDAIINRLTEMEIPADKIHSGDYGLPVASCDVLINVPSVKVHTLTGIAASIKNYINFTDKPSAYHHEGSVRLGEAWMLPDVKGKTRLIIVDMLKPYFGPGPQINPLHRWNYSGIMIGTDPVAIDTICTKICQEKRNLFKGEEWLIAPPPESLSAADKKYNLGTSDPFKINLQRIGWEKGMLI